jgi:ribosomal protein S27E
MIQDVPKWRREVEEILGKAEAVADAPITPSKTLYPDSQNRIKCAICGTLFQLPMGKFTMAKCPKCGQYYQRL